MCGIVGIFGPQNSARLTYLGLYALQHRGEESAGIVTYDGKKVSSCKNMGLVGDVFSEDKIKSLKGNLSIGHNRYSTTGSSLARNIQPFLANFQGRPLAVAHNGNLTNTAELHQRLEKKGSIFQTSLDSEIIVHLLANSKKPDQKDKVIWALSQLQGSYSLVLLSGNTLVGARDPRGFKPLCLGQIKGAWVLVSETSALDLIEAKYVREIEPGEVLFINKEGLRSLKLFPQVKHSFCIFEYIYFARPDSNIFGHNVYLTRKRLGRQLAREHPVGVDLVMPIPDSGNYAALGFAEKSKIPYEVGMIRNHYIGRTFIQPSQFIRDFRVKVKLNPIKEVLKRVSCPPIRHPCFYGIDFPTEKELIASNRSLEEIRDFIGLDSLKYLSLEGMLNSMPLPKGEFCTACFNGKYPVKPNRKVFKEVLEE
jgi:amidophosphoribosyltransferase